jgi:hypothetical protein
MPQPTVIPVYFNGIFLSCKMFFTLEYGHEAIPIIGGNTSSIYTGIRQSFLQLSDCFRVPSAAQLIFIINAFKLEHSKKNPD